MKKYLAIAIVALGLSGCAWLANNLGGTPSQGTKATIVEVFADSCNAYASALNLATQAMQANLLSEAQIADIEKARSGATPVCTGPQPTNLASAWVIVNEALLAISSDMKGAN